MILTARVSWGWTGVPIDIEGPPDESAHTTLERALGRQHNEQYPGPESDWSGFLLEFATLDSAAPEIHYLPIDKDLSFEQFLRLSGTAPSPHVSLHFGGQGGDGRSVDFVSWAVTDLWPALSTGLTAIGLFEIAVKAKQQALKRLRRNGYELARNWLAAGGPPPSELIDLVHARQRWSASDLKRLLALPLPEGRDLMHASGYSWSPKDEAYWRPTPWDAVN